jgi:hypothetical protein
MRSHWRVAALLSLAVVLVLVGIVVGLTTDATSHPLHNAGRGGSSSSSSSSSSTNPKHHAPSSGSAPPAAPRLADGSLGFQNPRIACTLLTRTEIARVFKAAVTPGAPAYPYCQWLVGRDMFVSLQVMKGVSFNQATQWVATYDTIRGLGNKAIIANDHMLYFTTSQATFVLQVQVPGNFEPDFDRAQLVTLGHMVLQRPLPSRPLAVPAAVPAGPPIYFAGDSTAAGPEWAYWQYYGNEDPGSPTRGLYEYVVGSGFVRSNFWNWSRHLVAEAAALRPKLVIFMGSANDDQDVIINGRYAPFGSPLWVEAYKKEIGSTMAGLVAEGCKVLWIGEPATNTPSLTAAMRVIDNIYAEEASAHPGVTFINPGTWLDGPHGTYRGTVKLDGHWVSAFLDGVHLNTSGSQYFAGIINLYVDRLLGLKRH